MCLYTCLYAWRPVNHEACLDLRMSMHMSVHTSVLLPVPSMNMPVNMSVHMRIHVSIRMATSPSHSLILAPQVPRYTYPSTDACAYAYLCTCAYARPYACTHAYTYACTCACIYGCARACMYAWRPNITQPGRPRKTPAYARTCAWTCVRTLVQTCEAEATSRGVRMRAVPPLSFRSSASDYVIVRSSRAAAITPSMFIGRRARGDGDARLSRSNASAHQHCGCGGGTPSNGRRQIMRLLLFFFVC